MRREHVWWILITLLAGIGLVACGPAPAPTPTPRPQHAPDVDYRAALAALDTYRARASLDIYPAEGTGLQKGHLEVEVDAVNRPERARRTTIRGLRSMARPEERSRTSDILKFVQVGGDLYMSTGTTWLKTPAQNNPEQGILDPATLLPRPDLFTLAQENVEVNGVAADRYTFSDPVALAFLAEEERAAIGELVGEVWLAREGNFIVRYRADARGTAFRFDMSPEPFAGRLVVAYDLYGPNEPLTIERPQEALGEQPKGQEDRPVLLDGFGQMPFPMPGAVTVVMNSHQLVVFDTPLAPDEVARFYARELARLGWTAGPEERGNASIRQTWRKNGYELRVTIVRGRGESTHVTVGVNPSQP